MYTLTHAPFDELVLACCEEEFTVAILDCHIELVRREEKEVLTYFRACWDDTVCLRSKGPEEILRSDIPLRRQSGERV